MLLELIAFVWLSFALFSFFTLKRIFVKYPIDYPTVDSTSEEWNAFVRTDFAKWDRKRLLFGAFFKLPVKFFALLWGLLFLLFFTYLKMLLGKKIMTFWNKFGKRLLITILKVAITIDIKDESEISAPIVVCNHVSWMDFFFLGGYFWPTGFLAKSSVNELFLIGPLARSNQCLFVERESANARGMSLELISKRIELYNQNPSEIHPLVIFPEGTTTNGKSLLKFKKGAFENLSNIEVFCLKYSSPELELGMEEIDEFEHIILSLSATPTLEVIRFKMSANPDETSERYAARTQEEISKATGYKIFASGYREKVSYLKKRALINGFFYKED